MACGDPQTFSVCPHCGYCPHCGRSAQPVYPQYPNYGQPYWHVPFVQIAPWTILPTTTITTTDGPFINYAIYKGATS